MSIIAIINQKGGCGKTTTSINLAATLAFRGKKTLLIDFDPQGHSSLGLGINEKQIKYSLFHVISGHVPLNTAIIPINENLSLLPSNISLASVEQKLAGKEGREFVLRNTLTPVKEDYQHIIIDCPPHLGLLSVNALLAADMFIVPIEPSRFALDGLTKLNQTVEVLCKKAGHSLQRKYLLSLFDLDSEFSLTFAKRFARDFGDSLFETKIHRSSAIREATHAGQPITDFDQNSVSFIDFMSLAHEVELWENAEIINDILAGKISEPCKTPLGVCFIYKDPKASSVKITGDFNNWDNEGTRLIKLAKEGIWYTFLQLKEGKYNYQYIVDGKYQIDPANPQAETSLFGVSQSVLVVQ